MSIGLLQSKPKLDAVAVTKHTRQKPLTGDNFLMC